MEPRLVFGTHYQVDEPAYMEFLVKQCTSGVQSRYKEVVAQKLTQEIRKRGRCFNESAGGYAVDLARGLGLVTPNCVWTDKGVLVQLIAETTDEELEKQLSLTLPEKLLHFRIFLEGDGAVFLYLGRYLVENGCLPAPGTSANSLVQGMFVEILSDYLSITNNTADRVALRGRIEQLTRKEYQGHTGDHKLFVHMQTLYRIGLAEKRDPASRVYCLPEAAQGTAQGLSIMLSEIPDILALEKIVSSHRIVEISATVLQIPSTLWGKDHREKTVRMLAQFYGQVLQSGIPLCPLSTLLEATQIALLAQGVLLGYDRGLNLVTEMQRRYPKQVRFHVDRRGQPAFVKISEHMLKELVSEGAAV